MKFSFTLFFCFLLFVCFSQNQHKGVILDNETKEPIEFVSIYNTNNHTLSNSDGRYAFSSKQDSVLFFCIGYDKFEANFTQLRDTIFLSKSVFELNEVVVTNAKTIYQKIKDSISSNYLLIPHTETFFLRALLSKNDSIVRIQDIQGRLRRKTSVYTQGLNITKKDFQVEIQNMRKIGISKDKNDIYFEFPTLYNIFSEFVRINAMGPDFTVTEQPFENQLYTKVEFHSNLPANSGVASGQYIINSKDHAILSFKASYTPYYSSEEKSKNKITSKILENNISVFFKQASYKKENLYFINSAKRMAKIQISGPDNSFTDIYKMSIILTTSKSFGAENFKSTTNEHKELFKLKHKYNTTYWQTQNQLLLTDEMQNFIKKIGKQNTEFKTRSNMN